MIGVSLTWRWICGFSWELVSETPRAKHTSRSPHSTFFCAIFTTENRAGWLEIPLELDTNPTQGPGPERPRPMGGNSWTYLNFNPVTQSYSIAVCCYCYICSNLRQSKGNSIAPVFKTAVCRGARDGESTENAGPVDLPTCGGSQSSNMSSTLVGLPSFQA